jgi:3-oxoacyl-[acyl-carrier protein] reductase
VEFKNKNVLVCGGSDGIGKATAIEFAKAGANVTLVARNEAKLQSVVAELDSGTDQQHNYLVADFMDPIGLKQVVSERLESVGTFHVLINNSGGPPAGKIFDADLDAFDAALRQHLKCNHLLVQTVVPGMKLAHYGRIINVISTSVKQPLPNLGVSNTIRGAVANWAKTLANELGEFGITVNNVLPGATATGRLAAIINHKAEKTGLSVEQVAEEMKSEIPMRRFAQPAEVANAIVFLASPRASYINGINLPVDGGRTKSL